MPTINFGNGADGPLASLEVGAKYDTTYFPQDLSEAPYFIVFRAKKRYKVSQVADVKVKYGDDVSMLDSMHGPRRPGGFEFVDAADKSGALGKIVKGARAVSGFVQKIEEKFGIDIDQPAHSFALPVPSNLQTSYKAGYNTTGELGAGGAMAREVAENFQSTGSGNLISDIRSAVKSADFNSDDFKGALANLGVAAAGADVGVSALIGGLVGGIGGGAAAAALGSLGTGALRGLGIARNPHIANVFTGVNFKEHNFQYKLIAKNKKESDTIRDLIRNFKYHMAPDYQAEGHIFKYPSQFEIILRAGDYLFKIGDSFLTQFDVNYTGEGTPVFFEDTNAPYSVTISLSFVEDTIVTKQEVRQGR